MFSNLSSDKGFSLLELLVAIAILSLAVIPMISSQSAAVKSTSILTEKALAKIVAENALTMFKSTEVPPSPGRHTGNDQQGGFEFNWHANVEYFPAQYLMSVQINVTRVENSGSVYEITGFRQPL